MNRTRPLIPSGLLVLALLLGACGGTSPPSGSGSDAAAAGEGYERGPHRGRMLRDGNLALELQVYEQGVPPEFHVYLYRDGQPLRPQDAEVEVQLTRLDGEVNRFAFVPEGDFLKGGGVVNEPHSFAVEVVARVAGAEHRWNFDSFEGRVTIPAATAADAGITTEVAGPAAIADVLPLSGRLVPDSERVRAVTARFVGPVREVYRSAGDIVRAGDRLALVESNESLQAYAVTAPIAGTVLERHVNPGEIAGAEPLFVIVDQSSLWAELPLFPRDFGKVRPGQRVTLRSPEGGDPVEGRVLRLVPGDPQRGDAPGTQRVRVSVPNADRRWTPGQFVEAAVEVGSASVPLAVKRSALQAFRDFTVVFEQVGDTYEVRMLELGRQDAENVEVLGGLKPGVRYVTGNSYLIKADIEKSGASHDH